jgi:hypothetical protein
VIKYLVAAALLVGACSTQVEAQERFYTPWERHMMDAYRIDISRVPYLESGGSADGGSGGADGSGGAGGGCR